MVEHVDSGARLPGSNQLTIPGCVEGGSFLCLSVLLFVGCNGELMIVPASSGCYED